MMYKPPPDKKPDREWEAVDVYGTRDDAESVARFMSKDAPEGMAKVYTIIYLSDKHYKVKVDGWWDLPT